MPLAIRRTRKSDDGSVRVINTRGPYLTEATYEDGGCRRRIVIENAPGHLIVRQLGRRNAMTVPYERIYLLAAQIAAAAACGVRPANRRVARGRL